MTGAWTADQADAADALAWLRAEFPAVGFVADPRAGTWFAVKGAGLFLRAPSGVVLRDQLLAAVPNERRSA